MGVYLAGVHLMGVYLINVHLTGVHVTGVYLTDVHLIGAYLINVYLTGVHLTGVYLMGVQFMGVHLIDVYFMDVYMLSNPKRPWGKPSDPPHLANGWSIRNIRVCALRDKSPYPPTVAAAAGLSPTAPSVPEPRGAAKKFTKDCMR